MNKILIIDDEPPVRKMLRKLLEKSNYYVWEADNGKQGIESYKKNNPDLIITDLIMPEKEGLETIKGIKKMNPDMKIIAISGGGFIDPKTYLYMAEKFGAEKTFAKPVNNEELLLTVKNLLTN